MNHQDILVGGDTGDDAAVYRIGDNTALVLTVDFFPPIIDDPFSFGAIAVANSLSDVYAMGGRPLVALNIVGFPAELPKEILGEILRGGQAKAQEADCTIIGGHTVYDNEPKYGLAVVGTVEPGKEITNAGCQPGDNLVLTKPLGTGIITTAAKQDATEPGVVDGAVAVMITLNRAASEAMIKVGVNACTDITGFGLIGHLSSMMKASGTAARVNASRVPVIPGTLDLIAKGIAPAGTRRNLKEVGKKVLWHKNVSEDTKILLADAQTSGGLLISISPERTDGLLSELGQAGVEATVVGEVSMPIADSESRIQVLP